MSRSIASWSTLSLASDAGGPRADIQFSKSAVPEGWSKRQCACFLFFFKITDGRLLAVSMVPLNCWVNWSK